MNKERELLERALEALDGGPLYRLRLKEEIRDYLANANSSEAEPVAWVRYNPVHSTIQDELEEKNK